MNKIMISVALIISMMGCAAALDFVGGVEMRPGEAAAEARFEHGFGSPWVGGDPPQRSSFYQGHPQFYSINRPGFPFIEPHYWTGVHIRPFRICHPFCDWDGPFYYSRSYFYGWTFYG